MAIEIKNVRRGSRFSRLARLLAGGRYWRSLSGAGLALLLTANSVLAHSTPGPAPASLAAIERELKLQDIPLVTERGVGRPVEKLILTQGYSFLHRGVDLDGDSGDPIYPILAGRIERVEKSDFRYGNSVLIDHGNEVKSLYAHLSEIYASEGDEVKTSTVIGEMGSTGWSTGSHLHLEVYRGGKKINPLSILAL